MPMIGHCEKKGGLGFVSRGEKIIDYFDRGSFSRMTRFVGRLGGANIWGGGY